MVVFSGIQGVEDIQVVVLAEGGEDIQMVVLAEGGEDIQVVVFSDIQGGEDKYSGGSSSWGRIFGW